MTVVRTRERLKKHSACVVIGAVGGAAKFETVYQAWRDWRERQVLPFSL